MPPINKYKCNKCDLSFPVGWGGYMYVEDNNGKRIICPHPEEYSKIYEVLGYNASEELIAERVGFNSHCLCLDCLHQFEADIEKDERKCPRCISTSVKTLLELVGTSCPKCKKGIIKEKCIGYS